MSTISKNLDRWAAVTGQKITKNSNEPDKLKAWVTKTLGILQSQGVYAAMLYLYANENEHTQSIRDGLWDLLAKVESLGISWKNENGEPVERPGVDAKNKEESDKILKFYSDAISSDLQVLLLIRELYEQTLIYARYHAEAEKNKSESEKKEE